MSENDATTEEASALWAELLADGRVTWRREGMLDAHTGRRVDHICGTTGEPVFFEVSEVWKGGSFACSWQPARLSKRAVPKFGDTATDAGLLAMAREGWKDPGLHARPNPSFMSDDAPDSWTVHTDPPHPDDGEWVDAMAPERETIDFDGPTVAIALMRAIEAAPEVTP